MIILIIIKITIIMKNNNYDNNNNNDNCIVISRYYRRMCYPVCGMVHIKEPLLLIDKSSLCGGSGFPFSLSEWS